MFVEEILNTCRKQEEYWSIGGASDWKKFSLKIFSNFSDDMFDVNVFQKQVSCLAD